MYIHEYCPEVEDAIVLIYLHSNCSMNSFATNDVHHPMNAISSEYLYHVTMIMIGWASLMLWKRNRHKKM